MQNHKIRKLTCINTQHAEILYYQLCELIGSLFVVHIGRSIYFNDPTNETPLDNVRHKEIERCKHNAMAFEDSLTEDDILYLERFDKNERRNK